MGLNDPVRAEYRKKRDVWILLRGNETFYDNDQYMMEWLTEADALEWATQNLTPAKIDPDQLKLL
jgi:hypothetical protein